MDHYHLHELVYKGHVYVEIWCGMYGLPQARRLANLQLQASLKPHGYHPCPITHGLWTHETCPIQFTLVVDDFAVRYTDKRDADHLMSALREHYQVTEDWTATHYCRITLTWDYSARTVDLSMPSYIDRALKQFQHPKPQRPEHAPHAWQRPPMVLPRNLHRGLTLCQPWMLQIAHMSRKSLASCSITPVLWTPPCWQPSAP